MEAPDKINLLMLEDSVDDAVYIQRTLIRSGIKLESRVVSTRHDFVTTMERFVPDLILSDHQLPRFTSTEALQICRKKFPFIPFILVTGAVSEEFAASIIQAGADDYLLKSNLKRLPTAVIQAIERKRIEESLHNVEEARRATEKELQEEHKRLLFHIENTSFGYIEWDSRLKVKAWSRRSEEIFGWTEKEFNETQVNGYGLVVEEDFTVTNESAESLLNGRVDANKVQIRNKTKDKGVIWCEWFNSVIRDESGKVTTILSMVQDITDRKNFEELLKQYNDRFEILSKATNDAIWDWDIEHDVEVWNHGIETIFGYTARETKSTKQWWKEKIHSNDFARVTKEMEDAFTQKSHHWTSEYQYLCADGSYKYVLDRGYILYENGKPVRMIGAMQDITEQKTFIREIEDLSLVASKTINSVVITDAEDNVEWVNEAFVNLTGYALSEIKGRNPGAVLQGLESDQNTIARMSEKTRNRESFTEEVLYYSKNGTKHWLRLDTSPVLDDQGKLNHFVSIQTDITAQKQFENQITNIARELSSLIENANVPIFGVDRNGYVSEWNKICAELFGYTKNEVLEKKLINFLDPVIHEDIQKILSQVFVGEATRNYELPFKNKDGEQLILLISISPRMDVNKNIYGCICVGQDITELFQYRQGLENIVKERTRDLNEALQKEKELVDLKSKFVSIASHEFRTPLSTISLATGILKKHREKFSVDEFNAKLETIEKQVLHMTYLLDDILMIGKAEAGKIQTNYTLIPIEHFFTQTSNEVEGSGSHNIKIRIRCTVKEFMADEKLLRNIVINLLTNAIKFSNYVKDVYLNITNSDNYIKIEVEDKGIGIAEEDLDNIFSAFHRGGNVGAIPGTGLGLSIVKKAVDLLKGEIKVNSRIGKGTTFTIMLPLAV